MKRQTCLWMLALTMAAGPAGAGDTRAWVGAALGTGAGLIIGNNVHGVNPWVAVPVCAVAGGLVGHELDREHDARRNADDRVCYPGAPYVVQPPVVPPPAAKPPAASVPDYHPGVDLIKVSIVNSNGVQTEVPVRRIGESRFIGPQGEEYATLPTAKELAKRYGY